MLSEKIDPDRDITYFLPGISELEIQLPMFFSERVQTGKIPIENFVELTSTNAPKFFGLYPQKGTISIGSDADLAIWDLKKTVSINSSKFYSRSDFSPYHDWEVTGWPVITISRGEVV
jgi:dihydropyrimidinase